MHLFTGNAIRLPAALAATAVALASMAIGTPPAHALPEGELRAGPVVTATTAQLRSTHQPPLDLKILPAQGTVVFEPQAPGITDLASGQACTGGIISGVAQTDGSNHIWAELTTYNHSPVTVEVRLWSDTGYDETFATTHPSLESHLSVHGLEWGTTYQAEAWATDVHGVVCPPRYGSFTTPTGLPH